MKSFLRQAQYIISENRITLVAFLLFMVYVLLGIFGSVISPYDPLATNAEIQLRPPSWQHWFGTDEYGRDVLSRAIAATRLDLGIALSAVAMSCIAGSIVGTCAGYFGSWVDRISGRFIDTIMAFPLFVLAMGIVAALGNSVENIIYATAIVNLPLYARVVRSEVVVLRDAGYVEAARLSGNSNFQIMTAHIFPNVLPVMMVPVSLNMGLVKF